MPDTPPLPPTFLLGVDPGTTTGLAVACAETGTLALVTSGGPLRAARQIEAWAASGGLIGAYVEDARALPIYARHGGANRGERDRIARGVGGVDLLTGLYLDLLASLGVPAVAVEPVRAAKWDADALRRATGYARPTNEHGRDAARHVYGRTCLPATQRGGGAPSSEPS
ncbi:MAG TPA: hypothetical protein VGB53_01630 [Rubricoccaceae bacterium]|jgi:hypothetical protein